MRSGFPAWLGAVSLSVMLSACSVFGGKAAEEPPHRVVLKEGAIQIRDYGAYTVAETVVNDSFDAATRAGFGRLFDYISGDNRRSSKIEMTAPVVVTPDSIAANAPVMAEPWPVAGARSGLDGAVAAWTIAFVLPVGMTAETAPAPADARVALRDMPARRVAVIRFAGLFRTAAAATRRRKLAAWHVMWDPT